GTMMPEICEAPHLPVFPFIYHCAPYLMGWDVFITFPVQNFYSSRFQKSGEIFNEILITSPDVLMRTFTGLFK
ncbi:hypothetical protein U0A89_20905, partial [Escherichia coli]|nr:hypothetical protein [Escherichia coli]MDY9537135.1 hypothetical protein [Escherichia coli]